MIVSSSTKLIRFSLLTGGNPLRSITSSCILKAAQINKKESQHIKSSAYRMGRYAPVDHQDYRKVLPGHVFEYWRSDTQHRDELMRDYETGKRMLANIMGQSPEEMDEKSVSRALNYLLPSMLFDKSARPVMEHPDKIFPPIAALSNIAETQTRPSDPFFYNNPKGLGLGSIHHKAVKELLILDSIAFYARDAPQRRMQVDWTRFRLKNQEELKNDGLIGIERSDYLRFIAALMKIINHPFGLTSAEFLDEYFVSVESRGKYQRCPLCVDRDGRFYTIVKGRRKNQSAEVRLLDNGTGKFTVNGMSFGDYFTVAEDRQQLVVPFTVIGRLGDFDVNAVCLGDGDGFGTQSKAGAIRYGIARGLTAFVSDGDITKLQIAGLLTADSRFKERLIYGTYGARRPKPWRPR